MQEVFLKLHHQISRYDVSKMAMPWFFTLVHNACVDHLRKGSRPPTNSRRRDALELEELAAPMREDESTPDLSGALASLSASQRMILEMRHTQELSFREISTRTGQTEVSLRKLYSRTIASVRRWFEGSKGERS